MSIAARLRYAREARRLSQSQLARSLGLRPQTVQAIEAGLVERPRALLDLARALEVRPEWLLDGSAPMRPDAVRESAGQYQSQSQHALSDEALEVGRRWMALPQAARAALWSLLQALTPP